MIIRYGKLLFIIRCTTRPVISVSDTDMDKNFKTITMVIFFPKYMIGLSCVLVSYEDLVSD
jgi:hypothetical protein